MPEVTELIVGSEPWRLSVPSGRAVKLTRAAVGAPAAAPAELVRAALERPFHFEPLRRALTPDDRVAVVLDPALPHVAALLAEARLDNVDISPLYGALDRADADQRYAGGAQMPRIEPRLLREGDRHRGIASNRQRRQRTDHFDDHG